jgi:hypothetical protein
MVGAGERAVSANPGERSSTGNGSHAIVENHLITTHCPLLGVTEHKFFNRLELGVVPHRVVHGLDVGPPGQDNVHRRSAQPLDANCFAKTLPTPRLHRQVTGIDWSRWPSALGIRLSQRPDRLHEQNEICRHFSDLAAVIFDALMVSPFISPVSFTSCPACEAMVFEL